MKKVFLMAYARKNLGDDIFIKMLLEKYPKIDFFMRIKEKEFLEGLVKYKNLKILIGEDTDEELYKMNEDEFDAYVYIGGSIFMEGGKVYNLSEKFFDFVNRCKNKNIPFCYISCNYGPYQTKEYFELSKRNFSICSDICFRDKYSYNLFKDIDNVRYAPDFAFNYKIPQNEKIENSIGITVINLDIRHDLKHIAQEYHKFLINNINYYLKKGYKVYLYSFCKHEQDEIIMEKLMKEFLNNPKVEEVRYDGDIDKFLNTYSQMEYMICARFHAIILSCLCKQKMFVMSYSKKIDNVINDLELNLPILHFHKTDRRHIISKEKFQILDEKKIVNIMEKVKEQDMFFGKKVKNN